MKCPKGMKTNSSFMTLKCSMEKNIAFDEWIAQIEEVSNLTGKPKYLLALAKSSATPYTAWSKLERKL